MKKHTTLAKIILFALVSAIIATLAGCSTLTNAPVSVTGIEQSENGGYIITYSDGSTTEMNVNGKDGQSGANGKNGQDGKNLTVRELFDAYTAIEGNEDATLQDFLDDYLTFTTDTTAVINDCLRSAISVYTEFVETTVGYFGQSQSGIAVSSGSGVIFRIDESYVYAATNYHVVYDSKADKTKNGGTNFARKITCYLYGSESYPTKVDKNGDGKYDTDPDTGYYVYDYDENCALTATLIGGSAENDIAVIRMNKADADRIGGSIKAAEFADDYHVGQQAIAIGNPESEGISVTQGIVSVDNENIILSVDGTKRYHRAMRIDTAIYHGNSGGGLFDANGKLIGITNAGNEDDQNINYAIPLQVVRGTVDNILYYSDGANLPVSAKKITVGFTVTSSNARYEYDEISGYGKVVEDVNISEITQGSLAEAFSLAADDKITALTISGKTFTVNRKFDISDALLTARKTDTLAVSYVRGEQNLTTQTLSLETQKLTDIA